MDISKILEEKLKYLIEQESYEFNIIEIHYDSIVPGYILDVKFDYDGPIDPQIPSFFEDISTMLSKFGKILEKFTITRSGKLSVSQKVLVEDYIINEFNYKQEEIHIFSVSFMIIYINNE
jgi:hypothetical protein